MGLTFNNGMVPVTELVSDSIVRLENIRPQIILIGMIGGELFRGRGECRKRSEPRSVEMLKYLV